MEGKRVEKGAKPPIGPHSAAKDGGRGRSRGVRGEITIFKFLSYVSLWCVCVCVVWGGEKD